MATTVVVRNPGSGDVEVLHAGSTPPDWAVDVITNTDVFTKTPTATKSRSRTAPKES